MIPARHLDALSVRGAFTTREPPVGRGPRDGGRPTDLAAALAGLGLPGAPVAAMDQVHGHRVLGVDGPAWPAGEADGLVTTTPGLVLVVRVADCVPVLLATPGGVAAVHAGWRGTAAGVVTAGLDALLARTRIPCTEVRAVVGPAIGPCCYEVGDEVVAGLARQAPEAVFLREGPGRPRVDLQAVNAHVLEARGVRVEVIRRCTACDATFHSWRRDGPAAGRQVGLVALVPGEPRP